MGRVNRAIVVSGDVSKVAQKYEVIYVFHPTEGMDNIDEIFQLIERVREESDGVLPHVIFEPPLELEEMRLLKELSVKWGARVTASENPGYQIKILE